MSNEQEVVTESNESQDQQEGVEVQSAKDSGEQNEVEQKDSTERPEWLDPKFETPQQLQTSYKQLETKFHTRRDEIKAELVEEINQEASKDVPVSAGDYKIEIKDILKILKVEFKGVNVLENQNLREGIKIYSNWPTIPQLYVKKEFIGGCDIITEMFESGELLELFNTNGIDVNPS